MDASTEDEERVLIDKSNVTTNKDNKSSLKQITGFDVHRGMNTLTRLPLDIKKKIALKMNLVSVIKLSMTCQDFAELFEEQDDPSSFWREFLMKRGYDTTGIDDAKEYTLNQNRKFRDYFQQKQEEEMEKGDRIFSNTGKMIYGPFWQALFLLCISVFSLIIGIKYSELKFPVFQNIEMEHLFYVIDIPIAQLIAIYIHSIYFYFYFYFRHNFKGYQFRRTTIPVHSFLYFFSFLAHSKLPHFSTTILMSMPNLSLIFVGIFSQLAYFQKIPWLVAFSPIFFFWVVIWVIIFEDSCTAVSRGLIDIAFSVLIHLVFISPIVATFLILGLFLDFPNFRISIHAIFSPIISLLIVLICFLCVFGLIDRGRKKMYIPAFLCIIFFSTFWILLWIFCLKIDKSAIFFAMVILVIVFCGICRIILYLVSGSPEYFPSKKFERNWSREDDDIPKEWPQRREVIRKNLD